MNAVKRSDINITAENVFYEIRKQIRKVEKYAYQLFTGAHEGIWHYRPSDGSPARDLVKFSHNPFRDCKQNGPSYYHG
jgi:hypothetical protein